MSIISSILKTKDYNWFFPVIGHTCPITLQAKEEMQSVKIPTYLIDIFNKTKMAWAKALFSDIYKQDPTPGFSFSSISNKYCFTLESYFVDKHLSSQISTPFMVHALKRMEEFIPKELENIKNTPVGSMRDGIFVRIVDHLVPLLDKMVFPNRKEINIEIDFMIRIVERLRVQEEIKLFSELPLPPLDSNTIAYIRQSMKLVENDGCYYSPPTGMLYLGLTPEEKNAYAQFSKQFFTLRNERMLKILKDSIEKDLKIRETSPNAPFQNLVTLEKYEKEIHQKRQILWVTTALTVVGIFFFCKKVVLRSGKIGNVLKSISFVLFFFTRIRLPSKIAHRFVLKSKADNFRADSVLPQIIALSDGE